MITEAGEKIFSCAENDQGYAIFQYLTKKSIETLREETANYIDENKNNFFNAIEAENWIISFKPENSTKIFGWNPDNNSIREINTRNVEKSQKKGALPKKIEENQKSDMQNKNDGMFIRNSKNKKNIKQNDLI